MHGRISESPALGIGLGLLLAGSGAVLADTVPQQDLMSSLKQSFKQEFDHQVVRGHFDVGSPPDTHRYYCLVDAKTGVRQPNGVVGQPHPRADGMTGIHASAVSLYTCVSAEQLGMLDTTGYALTAGAGSPAPAPAPAPAAQAPAAQTQAAQTATRASAASHADVSPVKIDIAGMKLGMSPDEVRAALKSKQLLDYHESMEPLDRSTPSERFVNVIAAWTLPPSLPAGGSGSADGESYEVIFTPDPGREQAMVIVHSVTYSPEHAVLETALNNALATKFGGYARSADMPASPTWRYRSGGEVQVDDACDRRGLYGGLGGLPIGSASRPNPALETTPEEFRFQIDHCGLVIVTADHATATREPTREADRTDPLVTRFTVTAYSPAIGLAGSAAARSMRISADQAKAAGTPGRTSGRSAPSL